MFEPNVGQADSRARFISRTADGVLTLEDAAAVLSFRRGPAPVRPGERDRIIRAKRSVSRSESIRMSLVGASHTRKPSGEAPLPGRSHYFHGSSSDRWHTNVPQFGAVRYRDVYPRTDLVFRSGSQGLEYDLVLQPGGRPERLQLRFDGIRSLRLTQQGDLELKLATGSLVQHRPACFQEVRGRRSPVTGAFKILSPNTVGFQVGQYDATAPLTIDPVLSYCSYLGGSGLETVGALAVGPDDAVYVAGYTESASFPVKNALQPSLNGTGDIFVAKLTPDLSAIVWATYLGGGDVEYAGGIAVDSAGSVYIAGSTGSTDYPTMRAIQSNKSGGLYDGIVTKLAPSGSQLVYSTYLGGPGDYDYFTGIVLDSAGRALVAGSLNFDVVYNRLSQDGSRLETAGLLAGTATDVASGIALGPTGDVYLAGYTLSSDFPVKSSLPGAQLNLRGGEDAFVARFRAGTSELMWSVYLGGSDFDSATSIEVDGTGNVFVAGNTISKDFPVFHEIQSQWKGWDDMFVTSYAPLGVFRFSTYLGGSIGESPARMLLDRFGNPVLTGESSSPDFPVRPASFPTRLVGQHDSVVVRLDRTGSPLYLSAYIGGAGGDVGIAIARNSRDEIIVLGQTASTNLPTTSTALQAGKAGNDDAFLLVIAPDPVGAPSNLTATALPGRVELAWRDGSSNETGFEVERQPLGGLFSLVTTLPAGTTSYIDTGLAGGKYRYRVRAVSTETVSAYSNEVEVTVVPQIDPPSPPSGLTAQATSGTSVTLSWLDTSTMEDSFEVERRAGVLAFARIGTSPANNPIFLDSHLAGNTSYSYRVRAVNSAGASAYSNTATVATPPAPPSAPSALSAVAVRPAGVDLTWKDESPDETGFVVLRQQGSSPAAEIATLGKDVQTYRDAGGSPNTRYTYQVFARSAVGDSPRSNPADCLTFPAAPAELQLRATGPTTFVLTWKAGSTADGYQIERSDGSATFSVLGRPLGSATTYTDTSATAGRTSSYRVAAFNATGLSDYSNAAQGTATVVLTSLRLDPPRLRGGRPAVGIVRLNAGAPAGARVTLACSLRGVRLPRQVAIRSGQSQAEFEIRTPVVQRTTPVRIQASYSGKSVTAILTLLSR